MARLLLVLLVNGGELHKTGAAQCTGLKLTTVDNFKKITVVLRASLCKILISTFAHKIDFAHNFSVDFF